MNEKRFLSTIFGEIAVFVKKSDSNRTPVVFLHGVYFDSLLWKNQTEHITDRTIVAIDMPLHGESRNNIRKDWTLDDCAEMLKEIVAQLGFQKIIAVGHSWGSMTIVITATKYPQLFEGIGICNMPFASPTAFEILKIKLIHSALVFRSFYMKQAAKALFSNESRTQNPEIVKYLFSTMSKLSNDEIRLIDTKVRIESYNLSDYLKSLKMPVLALVGEKDYVGIPPVNDVRVVKGAHVSPLEQPEAVNKLLDDLISHTK